MENSIEKDSHFTVNHKRNIIFGPYFVIFLLLCGYIMIFTGKAYLFLQIKGKPTTTKTNAQNKGISETQESFFTDFATDSPNIEIESKNGHEQNIGAEEKTHNQTSRVNNTESSHKKKMACYIRDLDPFDPKIMKYYNESNKFINCANSTQKFPLLFKTDLRSTLIQVDDPQKYGYYFCCYSEFNRDGSDMEVYTTPECRQILEKQTVIPDEIEFIVITCATSPTIRASRNIVDIFNFIRLNSSRTRLTRPTEIPEKVVLANATAHLLSNDVVKVKVIPKSKLKKVNVAIFGLDGISHMNFIRTMPKSYSYLTHNLSGLGLWGYTKVGDNTFPNIVPVLTGLFEEELKTTAKCRPDLETPFDDCPFIWKDFSKAGYFTAYGEDAANLGIFNYQKPGFKNQPTDSYIHAMTHHQSTSIGHNFPENANLCYGPRLGFQVLLNYLKQMAVTNFRTLKTEATSPYFQLIWATSLTHDSLNSGKMGDKPLLETLHWFKNGSYLEDTILILMSDHGIRYGGIRETQQGTLEGRMPFLYFVLPPWFSTQFPAAVGNLKKNKHRLTSPFDLHETLKDLINLKRLSPKSIKIRESHLHLEETSGSKLPRGISLFLPIPLKRTCEDASIGKDCCTCGSLNEMLEIENNKLLAKGAKNVVKVINKMLEEYPQCSKLAPKKLLNALVLESSPGSGCGSGSGSGKVSVKDLASITSPKDSLLATTNLTLTISLMVKPSDAAFEWTTTRLTNGKWVISGEINRINLYRNQSWCVSDYQMKKFCYCANLFEEGGQE